MNWRVSPVAGLHQNQMLAARFFFDFFCFFIKIQFVNYFFEVLGIKVLYEGTGLEKATLIGCNKDHCYGV